MSSSDNDNEQLFALLVIPVFAVVAALGGCEVEPVRFRQAAHDAGLENVEQGTYNFFECGYSDTWASDITATRLVFGEKEPRKVEGTVCCGIFKGCTVRSP